MIVPNSLPEAKETGDVGRLLVDLVKVLKTKGDYTSILPDLITAIDGIGQIGPEEKADKEVFAATIGYHLAKIPAILVG
jgi:hypothetical protein